MASRLLNFLEKQSFFTDNNGFRKKISTNLAKEIQNELENVNVCLTIFYLKKAFDTVKRNILVKKLEINGIRGTGLRLVCKLSIR